MPAFQVRSRPASTICSLASQTTTRPSPSIAASTRRAMSPVPPATSSTAMPGRGASHATISRFHRRWTPPLIRSFMRS